MGYANLKSCLEDHVWTTELVNIYDLFWKAIC